MKQEVIQIDGTSPKMIKGQLDELIKNKKEIQQVIPLGKTSFLVLIKAPQKQSKSPQGKS
jgi:hypothetical protein